VKNYGRTVKLSNNSIYVVELLTT